MPTSNQNTWNSWTPPCPDVHPMTTCVFDSFLPSFVSQASFFRLPWPRASRKLRPSTCGATPHRRKRRALVRCHTSPIPFLSFSNRLNLGLEWKNRRRRDGTIGGFDPRSIQDPRETYPKLSRTIHVHARPGRMCESSVQEVVYEDNSNNRTREERASCVDGKNSVQTGKASESVQCGCDELSRGNKSTSLDLGAGNPCDVL